MGFHYILNPPRISSSRSISKLYLMTGNNSGFFGLNVESKDTMFSSDLCLTVLSSDLFKFNALSIPFVITCLG